MNAVIDFSMCSGNHLLIAPHGQIKVFLDVPFSNSVRGLVFMAHPQPLLGGSAQHKVFQYIAK